MPTTANPAYNVVEWRFAAASTTGVSHLSASIPCQDAHKCVLAPSGDGQALIVVVSDGAGSATEGARGAQYICQDLTHRIQLALASSSLTGNTHWLRECIAETRGGLLAEAESLGMIPRQLAATLLCAVITKDWSAFGQVGDGAIVTPEAGSRTWAWLFWPQRGEYANTTSFLTDPGAMESLQVDTLPFGQHEVAVFTDGLQHLVLDYSEQCVHSPFFEKMLDPVRRSVVQGEDEGLSAGLARYLGSSLVSSRADDDLTLVLATRLQRAGG